MQLWHNVTFVEQDQSRQVYLSGLDVISFWEDGTQVFVTTLH